MLNSTASLISCGGAWSRAESGYRSVTWVGHSTVLLQLGGLNVLTDPIWSERASPLGWIGAYEPRWFMRTVHCNPEDAIAAHRALADGGRGAPPCLALHWGTFRLTDEPVEEPPARFAQRWREAGFPDSANWTLAHGDTRRIDGLLLRAIPERRRGRSSAPPRSRAASA